MTNRRDRPTAPWHWLAFWVTLAESCATSSAPQLEEARGAAASASVRVDSRTSGPAPSASIRGALGTPAAETRGCPEGMLRVEGSYCPAVEQVCLAFHPERERDQLHYASDRCLVYQSPSRCLSATRRPLAFCMDRHEYPNQKGELPRVLVSWREAQQLCGKQGKRLCSEDEFNFACEGPQMLPYAYGYRRDSRACHIDESYVFPDQRKPLLPYQACGKDPGCARELARLDRRRRIGSTESCVSWAGIEDLNGNVDEWVHLGDKKPPHRSGLKGGWWGPVRARCRPTVTFHKEHDYGYETGFRCCRDVPSEP